MNRLTESLVLRPTEEQTSRLATALSLDRARMQWLATLLAGVTTFVCLRQWHFGPIRSLMGAILVLAALATSLAPAICHAFLAHAVSSLRPAFFLDATQGRRLLRCAAGAYRLFFIGIWSSVAGYNLLVLSILLSPTAHPLERFFPDWPSAAAFLIAAGWVSVVLGERQLLRGLAR